MNLGQDLAKMLVRQLLMVNMFVWVAIGLNNKFLMLLSRHKEDGLPTALM
jgi:hypothetical protein